MPRERTESKRERAESAMLIRGGMGVRKKLEEAAADRTRYRLNGVQTGSVVVRAHDKYFGDFSKGYDVGVLVRRTALTVFIRWAQDEEITSYSQGDARYEVDRGRWKFLGPPRKDPLNPDDPVKDRLIRLLRDARLQVDALTKPDQSDRVKECDDAESASNPSLRQSSVSTPTALASGACAGTASGITTESTKGSDAKTTRKKNSSKETDGSKSSTGSPSKKSKRSGHAKGKSAASASGADRPSSTIVTGPAFDEDFSAATVTPDLDSLTTTQNYLRSPQNMLGKLLTSPSQNARIEASSPADDDHDTTPGSPTEEGPDMAKEKSNAAAEREAAQRALAKGDLKERETYTAKQVAMRLGTDAKTMRKFFRSNHSTVEPVGQGGRYEFDAADLPKIKGEFDAWSNRSTAKQNGQPTKQSRSAPVVVEELDEDMTNDELADVIETLQNEEPATDDEEPTEEELAEVADLELDLDDLDSEEV